MAERVMTGQRRGGQRVEGAQACAAVVALQAIGAAVAHSPVAATARASRVRSDPRLHQRAILGVFAAGAQDLEQLRLLAGRQVRHRIQPPLQFLGVYRQLQRPSTGGATEQSGVRSARGVSHHQLAIKEPAEGPGGQTPTLPVAGRRFDSQI